MVVFINFEALIRAGLEAHCVIGIVSSIWVVVKIMVPFWVFNIVRHLLFRVPKKGYLL